MLYPLCASFAPISRTETFFLVNHSNFKLRTFNYDWVGAIQQKQPLR